MNLGKVMTLRVGNRAYDLDLDTGVYERDIAFQAKIEPERIADDDDSILEWNANAHHLLRCHLHLDDIDPEEMAKANAIANGDMIDPGDNARIAYTVFRVMSEREFLKSALEARLQEFVRLARQDSGVVAYNASRPWATN